MKITGKWTAARVAVAHLPTIFIRIDQKVGESMTWTIISCRIPYINLVHETVKFSMKIGTMNKVHVDTCRYM